MQAAVRRSGEGRVGNGVERYLIETSKVDARMVHHEHAFSFGDKGGLLDEYGFLRNPQWVQGLKTLEDVANELGAAWVECGVCL